MRFIPYPLYSHLSCLGYQAYLDKVKIGNKYQFSGWFFLFNIFWLIRRRMYVAAATFTVFMTILLYGIFFYLGATNVGEQIKFNAEPENIAMALTVFPIIYTLISFLPFMFYHQHCLNKIDYTLKDPIEKLKPLNYISTIIIGFLMLILIGQILGFIVEYTILLLGK